jgi:hypothetical protein
MNPLQAFVIYNFDCKNGKCPYIQEMIKIKDSKNISGKFEPLEYRIRWHKLIKMEDRVTHSLKDSCPYCGTEASGVIFNKDEPKTIFLKKE